MYLKKIHIYNYITFNKFNKTNLIIFFFISKTKKKYCFIKENVIFFEKEEKEDK